MILPSDSFTLNMFHMQWLHCSLYKFSSFFLRYFYLSTLQSSRLGFQRWDILHHIMDIFQGWYKEGTRDYRHLSALYLLYRVALSSEYAFQILNNTYYNSYGFSRKWMVLGLFNVFLGMGFFILQPYKQKWMSNFDGWIFIFAGVITLLEIFNNKPVYILGGVAGFQPRLFLWHMQYITKARVYRTCEL